MKCDELEAYGMDDPAIGDEYEMYKVADVMEAIAELKEENESLLQQNRELCQALQVMYSKEEYGKLQKEIESLKASHYAESVDAGMRERRLNRALWLARAERAKEMAKGYNAVVEWCSHSRWIEVERKCLKKAEEYK